MTAKELLLDPSTMHADENPDEKNYSYVAVSEKNLTEIMNEIKKAELN